MQRISITILIVSLLSLFTSCASLNDALTPSATVKKDEFDGSVVIKQKPVSAASSLSEAWHTLGFQWYSRYPDKIFLEVGVNGIENVMGVAFNVDGQVIDDIRKASSFTNYGDWSTRIFVVPMDTFIKISKGMDVKMKVMQIDTYSVSSFGEANSGAVVDSKFQSFLEKVRHHK